MEKKKRFKHRTIHLVKAYKEKLDKMFGYGQGAVKASAQIGVTRNSLQQAFKKKYGFSIRQYKLKLRMERSIELLDMGKDVKEIAKILHYSTPRAFTHAFKKHYGKTPSEYIDS